MKKLISCFVCGFLAFSIFAVDILDFVSVKSDVKEMTSTEYSVASKFGDYFKTNTGKTVFMFDETGKIYEKAFYDARGNLFRDMRYTFSVNGNLLCEEDFASSGKQGASAEVKTGFAKIEYSEKKGNRSEITFYDYIGEMKAKNIYKYENDLMTEESVYESNGALVSKSFYKYDDVNRLEKETKYFGNGTLESETVYTYREVPGDNRYEAITIYKIDGTSEQKVFRYSNAGLLIEITSYENNESGNKVTKRTILKYDDDANLTKVSDYLVSEKFGGTVNELVNIIDYTYSF